MNFLTFLDGNDEFDVDGFKAAVSVVFTGQEIIVGNADYPTEKIGDTRPPSTSSASATPTSARC